MALTDSLISWWSLDETSGTRADSHGSNDLTDTNTVGYATGKQSNGGDFVRTSSEYLSHASNSDLTTGDIDWTIAYWVKFDVVNVYQAVVSKWNGAGEFWIGLSYEGKARFYAEKSSGYADLYSTASLSADTWYFITAWFDSTNDLIYIQINDATPESTACTDIRTDTKNWLIGAASSGSGDQVDGVVDEVGFWKRLLTSDERNQLYNSGNGVSYADLTSVTINAGVQVVAVNQPAATVSVAEVIIVLTARSRSFGLNSGRAFGLTTVDRDG